MATNEAKSNMNPIAPNLIILSLKQETTGTMYTAMLMEIDAPPTCHKWGKWGSRLCDFLNKTGMIAVADFSH